MLSHAAGTSYGYKLLWSHHSSLASQNCAFKQLSGCRGSHLHSYKHLGVWFLCFTLCRSTEFLSTCNTQLGLRPSGSLQDSIQPVFSWYWYTKYPTGMATLFLCLPVKFNKVELGMWLQRAVLCAGTALLSECMFWLNDVYGACLLLIIVLPFPFSVVRWQNYLL